MPTINRRSMSVALALLVAFGELGQRYQVLLVRRLPLPANRVAQ